MLQIERILCPMDFSEFSARAYDYAQSLAKHYGARLYVEHVVQPLTITYPYYPFPDAVNDTYWNVSEQAEGQLRELVNSHTPNAIKPELVIERGTVSQAILAFSEKESVDLIVMGTHGRQGLDHLAMGSVAEKVLRKARCPVLAVRRPAHHFVVPGHAQDPVQLRKLLFCTDFSEHSHRALTYAVSLAIEYNAELTLLHVLEHLPGADELEEETGRVIQRLESPFSSEARNRCLIKSVVRVGRPYQEIIQLALETHSDLVIMGVRGRNALDLALFGSTTHRVLQLGSCPVLAVRL
jgi:nucleotide-binding universal stress UspA family protein